MATRKTKGGSKTKKTGTKKREPLALQILAKDHKLVGGMFKRFERLDEDDVAEKEAIMREICSALTVHAMVEEEIFYRELRGALGEDEQSEDSLDEATVEHASLKALIGQLEHADVEDELVCAKVKVLGEYVKHHVAEEEDEIFKQARKAKSKGLDLDEMGERMKARKEQLQEAAEHTAMHDRTSARPQKSGRPAHATAAH